jgi:hypothetical protein
MGAPKIYTCASISLGQLKKKAEVSMMFYMQSLIPSLKNTTFSFTSLSNNQ